MMVTSEVTVNEERCKGCGYCEQFCPRECLTIPSAGKLSPSGYDLPMFNEPERCNTCGICARMCPQWAIDVHLRVTEDGKIAIREKVAGAPRLPMAPPLANCPWCQHPLVGRIVAEAVEELGASGRLIALEAVSCGDSSAFGIGFSRMLFPSDRPCDVATLAKRANPNAVVCLVQSDLYIPMTADSLLGSLIRGEGFTMIVCNDVNWRTSRQRPLKTLTSVTAAGEQELVWQGFPLHMAEFVAGFQGVAYSARSSLVSPDGYERTKSYVMEAFKKQLDGVGFGFVEVLCACAGCEWHVATRLECLTAVNRALGELPMAEFKNVQPSKREE